MNLRPKRPVLRWHGGKWRLAPWIISHFPPHRIYVEPFGGAASVLIRKPRAYAEIYNDLDDEVVALFRILRSPEQAAQLREALRLTPFARVEFREAYQPSDDPVERSRRLIIRSFMGFGSNAHASQEKGHRSTGFRATSNRSGTTPAMDWANYPEAMDALVKLSGPIDASKQLQRVADICAGAYVLPLDHWKKLGGPPMPEAVEQAAQEQEPQVLRRWWHAAVESRFIIFWSGFVFGVFWEALWR